MVLDFLVGWSADRVEDAAAVACAMSPGLERRMRRMRAWRQSLTGREATAWAADGSAGPELRGFFGGRYSPGLEAQLVWRQPGEAEVHQHEVIWIRNAKGTWVQVEALLDSGNNAGLCIPAVVAIHLGYSDERGKAYSHVHLGNQSVRTAVGSSTNQCIVAVTFSIAGVEFTTDTAILSDATGAQLCAAAGTAAVRRRPAASDAIVLEVGQQHRVLVPAQIIRLLNRSGVRFSML